MRYSTLTPGACYIYAPSNTPVTLVHVSDDGKFARVSMDIHSSHVVKVTDLVERV